MARQCRRDAALFGGILSDRDVVKGPMKHTLLCAAAALALMAMSAPVSAPALAQAVAPDVLPPHEIVTIVRSAGLNPIDRPVRRGMTYVFRAIGARGQEMRVTVDARYGDVMSVAPVANAAPRLGPGMTLGPYERVERDRDDDAGPMTLSPPGIYGSRPPPIGGMIDDDDDTIVYAPGASPALPGTVRPPAPVTSAPLAAPSGGQPAYSMPPQQRMQASTPQYSPPPASVAPSAAPMPAPSGSTASVGETQQLGEGGLLPPPPERFPQRVAPPAANAKPAANTKPAAGTKPAAKPAQQKPAATQPKPAQQQKTAASGTPPAKPPLPKSKPAAAPSASTPSASTPAPAPAAAPLPAKKNESDDVPH